jgi:hypothetical protein
MGCRDRARADHVGALTGFCSARRRPKRTGDRQGWNQSFDSGGRGLVGEPSPMVCVAIQSSLGSGGNLIK